MSFRPPAAAARPRSCNKKVVARKRMSLFRTPTALTVHLKRFQFAHLFGGKINRHIGYETKLDLARFMSHKQVGACVRVGCVSVRVLACGQTVAVFIVVRG